MLQESDLPTNTTVVFSSEARQKLFSGLEQAAEAVSVTLGPKGKTVLIQRNNQVPIVTKDGVTVSKAIKLKDPAARMGAELIKEAASQTNDIAGDGTTTATVLTHAMVKNGLKLLEAGYTSKELCEGIACARILVENILVDNSKQLSTISEIAQIGTISANGDQNIGQLIAQAMDKVGRDGIITVEDAKGTSTSLEIVEGMQFDRGYLSPYFVTNSDRMNVVYNDVRVLVTDKKLSSIRELVPVLEKVVQSRTPLLIIAEDVEGEALQGLVLNRVNAQLPIVAVKAPGYAQHRDELLHDIAVLSGTKIFSPSTGLKVESATMSDLGHLKRITVDSRSTTLVGTGSTKSQVEKHVEDLRLQTQDVTISQDELTKLKTRIAKLASGVAVIRVGGSTEVEMIERKYRIEDALHATKAAADEGIVQGGGMALFYAKEQAEQMIPEHYKVGASILLNSCIAPLSKIATNAGVSADVIVNELKRLKESGKNLGYNAANGKYEDLFDAGVIDPLKVTKTALKNAVSVAVTFLSLDAIIIED